MDNPGIAASVPLAAGVLLLLLPEALRKVRQALAMLACLASMLLLYRLLATASAGEAVRSGEDLAAVLLGPLAGERPVRRR